VGSDCRASGLAVTVDLSTDTVAGGATPGGERSAPAGATPPGGGGARLTVEATATVELGTTESTLKLRPGVAS